MSGQPKYRVIADALRAEIESGALAPGDALPSQRELAERHRVTVMTVRQALARLAEAGLVVSEHGRGTFVTPRSVELSLGPLTSLADQAAATGRTLTTTVIDHSPTAEGHRIVRLRRLDGQPFALQTSLLAPGVEIAVERLGDESLYAALADAGRAVTDATETVRAVVLDREDADLLGRAPHSPALLSVRESRTTDGRVVLTDRALIPGAVITVERARLHPHPEPHHQEES
ncbi:transcriptional regulator [Enemella dayhoffiae]|uniref:Transcriptional regulator n=1 Tax=Enemella dayhoffiae TaxID=2016507 RepID=A0A255GUF4_9ACTN|nr:GntR family transcriptional regulator [Enemella dayhoffiae]OYO19251.1 transcriptional regulator [Enemella dayhoffiae]